jgi:hypothetical protein
VLHHRPTLVLTPECPRKHHRTLANTKVFRKLADVGLGKSRRSLGSSRTGFGFNAMKT